MSHRHGCSRRRSYGPRQRELRRRRVAIELSPEPPAVWPRGRAWENDVPKGRMHGTPDGESGTLPGSLGA